MITVMVLLAGLSVAVHADTARSSERSLADSVVMVPITLDGKEAFIKTVVDSFGVCARCDSTVWVLRTSDGQIVPYGPFRHGRFEGVDGDESIDICLHDPCWRAIRVWWWVQAVKSYLYEKEIEWEESNDE